MGIDPYLTPGSLSPQAEELFRADKTNLESGAIPKTIIGTTFLNKAKQDELRATNAAIEASARAAKAEQNIAMRDSLERQLLEKIKVSEDKPFRETYGAKVLSGLARRLVDPETQDRGLLANFVGADSDAEKEVREETKEKEKRDIAKLKAGLDIAQKQVDRPGQQKKAALQLKKLERQARGLDQKTKKLNFNKTKFIGSKEFKSFKDRAITALKDVSITPAEAEQLKKINPNLDDILEDPSDGTKNVIALKAIEYITNQGLSVQEAVMKSFLDSLREGSAKEN